VIPSHREYHPLIFFDGAVRGPGILLAAHTGHDEFSIVGPVRIGAALLESLEQGVEAGAERAVVRRDRR
jgi:hypothetical protein